MSPHDHDHDHAPEHQHTHEPLDYEGWLAQHRAAKDAFFREAPGSPIPAAERAGFEGLAYYPADPALRFEGLEVVPRAPELPMELTVQTSDGAVREGHRAGAFVFDVAGVEQRLTALQLAGASGDALFVPFRDATSGPETYGAGRYLDLAPAPDGGYDLDFNLAYAPFCAYSPQYSCPLPPPENRLAVAITAGERNSS